MRSHLAWLGEKARAMRAADAARLRAELDASHAEAVRIVMAAQAEALCTRLATIRAHAEQRLQDAEAREKRDGARIAALEGRLDMAADLLREVYISRDGYTVCPVCLLTWPSHRTACAIGRLVDATGRRDGNRLAQPTGRRA